MSYCTQADVEESLASSFLAELIKDTPDPALQAAAIATAIESADAEIDGYIGVVVSLPYDQDDPLLRRLATRMAIYFLMLRRGYQDQFLAEYENCQRQLRDIATGRMSLPGSVPQQGNPLNLRYEAL